MWVSDSTFSAPVGAKLVSGADRRMGLPTLPMAPPLLAAKLALAAWMRWLLSASPRMSPVLVSDTVPERPTSMVVTAWSRRVFSTKFRPVLSASWLIWVLPLSTMSKVSWGALTW